MVDLARGPKPLENAALHLGNMGLLGWRGPVPQSMAVGTGLRRCR